MAESDATGTFAPASDGSDDALAIVVVRYRNRAQLQLLGSRFQHVDTDEATRTAVVEASRDDLDWLRRHGLPAEIDDARTERLHAADLAMRQRAGATAPGALAMPPVAEAIPGYACYRTVEETHATMQQLAIERPALARVVSIGPSWLRTRAPSAGYNLYALRVTNSATDAAFPNKPTMVLVGAIHAREYTTAEVLTRFAEWLVDGHGIDDEATWLVDNFRFHFVLQANPDGRKKAESGLSWRKNVNTDNGSCSANAYGIDLNRNFPYRWNATSGSGSSGDPCASTYRGPHALSEPESVDLLRYVAGQPGSDGVYRGGVLPDLRTDAGTAPSSYPGLYIDVHSNARRVLWPWAYSSTAPPNATALRTLGRRLAWFTGYRPSQWVGMYVGDGVSTDAIYGLLGAPAYTLEIGQAFFEDCSTFTNSTLPANLASLRYAARTLPAPYTAPSGPDTTSMSLSAAKVDAGRSVTVTATVDDSRFNQSNGTEAVQDIASARAYLDVPPWNGSGTSFAMQATDGAFDEPTETVRVTIPTGALASGRHTVYVRATDAAGRAGTAKAAVFTVMRLVQPAGPCMPPVLASGAMAASADPRLPGN